MHTAEELGKHDTEEKKHKGRSINSKTLDYPQMKEMNENEVRDIAVTSKNDESMGSEKNRGNSKESESLKKAISSQMNGTTEANDNQTLQSALLMDDLIERAMEASNAQVKNCEKPVKISLSDALIDDYITKLLNCVDRSNLEKLKVTDVLKDCNFLFAIVERCKTIFEHECSLLEIETPINICGDIHGQFTDLLRIFSLCGRPPVEKFLFLGDYVDRGPNSLETICLLLLLKIRYPLRIYLLRGNHECSTINRNYGFYDECCERFKEGDDLWAAFQEMFNWLPFTARVSSRILCMHGGLSPELKDISQLQNLERPIDPMLKGLSTDLLWSDPSTSLPSESDGPDWSPSTRGISYWFSKKTVIRLCDILNIDMVVRAHQVVQDGYEFFACRRMITLFSAPNYCGQFNNSGAVLTIDKYNRCTFNTLKPERGAPVKKGKSTEADVDDELNEVMDNK